MIFHINEDINAHDRCLIREYNLFEGIKVLKRSPRLLAPERSSAPPRRVAHSPCSRTSTGTFAKKSIDSLKFANRSRNPPPSSVNPNPNPLAASFLSPRRRRLPAPSPSPSSSVPSLRRLLLNAQLDLVRRRPQRRQQLA
jgi:hypothetical protein